MGSLEKIENAYRERGNVVVSARFDYEAGQWECSVAIEPVDNSAPIRQTVLTYSLEEGMSKLAGAVPNE